MTFSVFKRVVAAEFKLTYSTATFPNPGHTAKHHAFLSSRMFLASTLLHHQEEEQQYSYVGFMPANPSFWCRINEIMIVA